MQINSIHKNEITYLLFILILGLGCTVGWIQISHADDWTTYQHDNRRSGITDEPFHYPLEKKWDSTSLIPPQTAWPGPAKWDSYANIRNLKSMRDFDPVFYTTVVGNRVYWGSSVDDSVHCVDLETGQEQWLYCTDGPVRLPPSFYKGKVYFGSDDGTVYCVDAPKGSLVWKYNPAPDLPKIASNGKLISPLPCRTGAFVQNGIVYAAFSLLPWEKSYLCAVDAETGSDQGEGLFKVEHIHATMQGAILASSSKLYLSHGRQQPRMYDRKTGKLVGSIGQSGDGGCFALLTKEDILIQGRGQNHRSDGELRGFNLDTKDHLATFPAANCMVIQGSMAYLHSKETLTAFDRLKNLELQSRMFQLQEEVDTQKDRFKKLKDPKGETKEGQDLLKSIQSLQTEIRHLQGQLPSTFVWKKPVPYYYTLILAGDILIAGGKNRIDAYDRVKGEKVWDETVVGNVYGLTYANGHLLVSTDRGQIVCYGK